MASQTVLRHDQWLIELAILENAVLAFEPIEVIAVKQTITMRDSITAYSTAVGPSSDVKKRCNFDASDFI